MIRLLYFIPTYLLFLLFRSAMILLGWVLIPPQALLYKVLSKEEISIVNGRKILNWKLGFMYIWSNQEDGIVAGEEFIGWPTWWRIIYWSAIRNPANNLRFLPYISCKIIPSEIEASLSDIKDIDGQVTPKERVTNLRSYDDDRYRFITLIWQGWYSNLRIQFKMFGKIWRFWIGWKIYAHDSLGVNPLDYRAKGAGFATQFKRIYPR